MSIDRQLNIIMNTDQAAQGMARLGISVIMLGQLIRDNLNTNAKIASTSLSKVGSTAQQTTNTVDNAGKSATKTGLGMRGLAAHSDETNKALLKVSSGAQGFMIGSNLLDHNLQGLAFSMIFLQRTQLAVALGTAALTVGLLGTAKALDTIVTSGEKAANTLQDVQVQMNAYLQDKTALSNPTAGAQTNAPGTAATAISKQAFSENQRTGMSTDDLTGALFNLSKFKLNSQAYVQSVEDTAVALHKPATEIAAAYDTILEAPLSQRTGLMQQLAIAWNLPIKQYATTLDIANAAEKRFAGSQALFTASATGQIGILKGAWENFTQTVGTLIQKVVAPFFAPLLAFIQAISKGFQDAQQSATVSGQLAKNMQLIQDVAKQITPWLVSLGTEIGHVLFNAIMNGIHVFKTLIDTSISVWHNLKPIVDFIISLILQIKKLIDWIISWYQAHQKLADKLAEAYILLVALGKAIDIINAIVAPFAAVIKGIGAIASAAAAAWDTVSKLASLIAAGAEGAYNITLGVIDYASVLLDAIAGKVKDLAGKIVDITVGITDKATSILDGILDRLGKLKDKTINVLTNSKGEPTTPNQPTPPGQKSPGSGFNVGSFLGGLFGGAAVGDMVAGLMSILSQVFSEVTGLLAGGALDAIGAGLVAGLFITLVQLFPKQMGTISGALFLVIQGAFLGVFAAPLLLPLAVPWIVGGLISAFKSAIGPVSSGLAAIFEPLGSTIGGALGKATSGLRSFVSDLSSGDIVGAAGILVQGIELAFIGLPSSIAAAFMTLPGEISGAIAGASGAIGPALQSLGGVLASGIETYLAGNAKVINTLFENLPQPIKDFLDNWGTYLSSAATTIVGGFQTFVVDPFTELLTGKFGIVTVIQNAFGLISGMASPWDGITNALSSADWDIKNILNNIIWALNIMISGFDAISFHIPSIGVGPFKTPSFDFGGVGIPLIHPIQMAFGGVVPGAVGTPQLIVAHGGEEFMGAPTIANGRNNGSGSGAGDIHIHLPISNSVITDASSMEKLANTVAGTIMKKLGSGRNMTLHSVHG